MLLLAVSALALVPSLEALEATVGTWTAYEGYNCYGGHSGGEALPQVHEPLGDNLTLAECKHQCVRFKDCGGIMVHPMPNNKFCCYLRWKLELSKCHKEQHPFVLHVLKRLSALPDGGGEDKADGGGDDDDDDDDDEDERKYGFQLALKRWAPKKVKWQVYDGYNCYGGHSGGEAIPGVHEPVGDDLTLSECRKECSMFKGCHGIMTHPMPNDRVCCYLRRNLTLDRCHKEQHPFILHVLKRGKADDDDDDDEEDKEADKDDDDAERRYDFKLRLKSVSYSKVKWTPYEGYNCYGGDSGGEAIPGVHEPVGDNLTLEECKQECSLFHSCAAIVTYPMPNDKVCCYLRQKLQLDKCHKDQHPFVLHVIERPKSPKNSSDDGAEGHSKTCQDGDDDDDDDEGDCKYRFRVALKMMSYSTVRWHPHDGYNCYGGEYGGDVIPGAHEPVGDDLTLEECKKECTIFPECKAIVTYPMPRNKVCCYLRRKLELHKCLKDQHPFTVHEIKRRSKRWGGLLHKIKSRFSSKHKALIKALKQRKAEGGKSDQDHRLRLFDEGGPAAQGVLTAAAGSLPAAVAGLGLAAVAGGVGLAVLAGRALLNRRGAFASVPSDEEECKLLQSDAEEGAPE